MELKNAIQWSEKSQSLSEFVSCYPLPQIVQVENGYHGLKDESSLSAGQILKIHKLTVERKLKCLDRNEKEICVPVYSDQRVILRHEFNDVVYQRVADLARAKPLPAYVEVTRGYYNVDSNVNYELSVDPGERLKVVQDVGGMSHLKRKKFMSFVNNENVEIKIPLDCVAGFRPLIDNEKHLLSDLIESETGSTVVYPFYFEFDRGCTHANLGVLKCTGVFDEKLIIASSMQDNTCEVVFMIPRSLDVTVKVASGTLHVDPVYESMRNSLKDIQELEDRVQNTRMSMVYSGAQAEISGFTIQAPPVGDLLGLSNIVEENAKWETFSSSDSNNNVLQQFAGTAVEQENTLKVKIAHKVTYGEVESNKKEAVSVEDKEAQTGSPIERMSVHELCESLKTLNMNAHARTFEENQVDGILFCTLEEDEFQSLGLNKFEIKKVLSFKAGWKPKLN